MKGFAEARKLENLELRILLEVRKLSPDTERAFPVSIRQWGAEKLEVNGIYASNRGEFFFIDFATDAALTVKLLDTRHALDLVNLLGQMGVVGNRSSLSELAYGEPPASRPAQGLLPPPKKNDEA